MSGRSKVLNLGDELPKLTEKECEALILVHPYCDAMSQREAAEELCIALSSFKDRLRGVYNKVPWLKQDIQNKREQLSKIRKSISRPVRLGDMACIGNDGANDTLYDEKIIRKF